MIVKQYTDIRFGQMVQITATMTQDEYNTVLSMCKSYNWSEVSSVMVLRGIRTKEMWDRVQITPIQ